MFVMTSLDQIEARCSKTQLNLHFSRKQCTFSHFPALHSSWVLCRMYQGCQACAGPLKREDWALIIVWPWPCQTNGSRWAPISCDFSLSTQMLLLCVLFCANDVVWCLQFTILGSSLFMKLCICSLCAAAVACPNPLLARLYLRMYQRGHFHFNSSQVFAWPCLFKMTKGRVLIEFASWVQGVIWDLAQPV